MLKTIYFVNVIVQQGDMYMQTFVGTLEPGRMNFLSCESEGEEGSFITFGRQNRIFPSP